MCNDFNSTELCMCVRSPQGVGCEIMSLDVPLRWGIVRLQHKPPATSRKGTRVRHCSADPVSQGDPFAVGKGPTRHLRGQSTAKLSIPTKVPARHTQDNCTPNPTSRAPGLETLHQRRAQRGDEKSIPSLGLIRSQSWRLPDHKRTQRISTWGPLNSSANVPPNVHPQWSRLGPIATSPRVPRHSKASPQCHHQHPETEMMSCRWLLQRPSIEERWSPAKFSPSQPPLCLLAYMVRCVHSGKVSLQ